MIPEKQAPFFEVIKTTLRMKNDFQAQTLEHF
jgi:hypothetical protein